MGKEISEMTLEELWELFPIILSEHRAEWSDWFEEERALLRALLSAAEIMRISHIGSTAVSTIWAKPTVDILIEFKWANDLQAAVDALWNVEGYIPMYVHKTRASFVKGYTLQGFAQRVFHLHLRVWGDNDELYFRDYLREHFDTAKEYEALKLGLWNSMSIIGNAYTDAKGSFVKEATRRAKQLYGERYA